MKQACENCGTVKVRIHHSFIDKNPVISQHPRELLSIPGYELVGTESYDFDKNHTYFVFQWIDVPISVEWATDARKKRDKNNG
jgi:hypothetical protein